MIFYCGWSTRSTHVTFSLNVCWKEKLICLITTIQVTAKTENKKNIVIIFITLLVVIILGQWFLNLLSNNAFTGSLATKAWKFKIHWLTEKGKISFNHHNFHFCTEQEPVWYIWTVFILVFRYRYNFDDDVRKFCFI